VNNSREKQKKATQGGMADSSAPVESLPNIGPVLAGELKTLGIRTLQDLKDSGSVAALIRLESSAGRHCMNSLYALEGAIQGIRWHLLSREEREFLRNELAARLKSETVYS